MKIRVDLNTETQLLLDEMAREANLTTKDLIKVAIFNLIALWMKERGKITPMDQSDDAGILSVLSSGD